MALPHFDAQDSSPIMPIPRTARRPRSPRHPRLAARLGALLLIAVTAFFGVGAQILFHATAHNYFNRDAVLFSIQMWLIGDFIGRLRETERGKRAIVIYTADHGEAWGEHKVYAHTLDLYGEQINVPLWIDAPRELMTGYYGARPDRALARRARREAAEARE
jgi:hypothetical protein